MIRRGIFLSFLTAIISGISIFSNSIFVSKADPLVFAIVRNTVVAFLLTVFLVSAGKIGKLKTMTKKEWGLLLAIGAIGGGIPFAMFFTGLSMIGPLNGNILHKTLFLWVALLAVPILKERLSKFQVVGYVALFTGMFVFGGTFQFVPAAGSYLVLGATMLWAVENIIAKVTLNTVPSAVVAWGRMVFGLPFLFVAAAFLGKMGLLTQASAYTPMPIIVSSVLLTAYVTTWYTALALAPATIVSSVLVFAPVVTALLSSAMLKKTIGSQLTNFILLTAGALLVSMEKVLPKKQVSEG